MATFGALHADPVNTNTEKEEENEESYWDNTANFEKDEKTTGSGSVELTPEQVSQAIKANKILLSNQVSYKLIKLVINSLSDTLDKDFINAIAEYQTSKNTLQKTGKEEDKNVSGSKANGIIDESTFDEILNDLLTLRKYEDILALVTDYYNVNYDDVDSLLMNEDIKSLPYFTVQKPDKKHPKLPFVIFFGKLFFEEEKTTALKRLKKVLETETKNKPESDLEGSKEWEAYPGARNGFGNNMDVYLRMRRKLRAFLKLQDSEKSPMQYLSENIIQSKFLGQTVWVHKNFAKVLNEVESSLRAKGIYEEMEKKYKGKIQNFWVRSIAGSSQVSEHAIGMAVDIDAGYNPHITNPIVMEVIKYVTGTDIYNPKEEPEPSAEEMKKASNTFKKIFNEEYIKNLEQKGPALKKIEQVLINVKYTGVIQVKIDEVLKMDAKKRSDNSGLLMYEVAKAHAEYNIVKKYLDNVPVREYIEQRFDYFNAVIGKILIASILKTDPQPVRLNKDVAKDLNVLSLLQKEIEKVSKMQIAVIENKDALHTYASKGFFSLSLELVNTFLERKEIRWGGEYQESKDFMHFELHRYDNYL